LCFKNLKKKKIKNILKLIFFFERTESKGREGKGREEKSGYHVAINDMYSILLAVKMDDVG
jgi:hypothetical protein